MAEYIAEVVSSQQPLLMAASLAIQLIKAKSCHATPFHVMKHALMASGLIGELGQNVQLAVMALLNQDGEMLQSSLVRVVNQQPVNENSLRLANICQAALKIRTASLANGLDGPIAVAIASASANVAVSFSSMQRAMEGHATTRYVKLHLVIQQLGRPLDQNVGLGDVASIVC
jgi:hypothetical protein